MRTLDLLERVESIKVRSAWRNGVKTYAIELLDNALSNRECEYFASLQELKAAILNGASDWKQFSYGGMGFVYDEAICRTLCSPSEYRKMHYKEGGVKQPNSRETWCDVEARALSHAWELIKRVYNEMPKDKYIVIPYPAAPNLWCVYNNYTQSVIFGNLFKCDCEKWVNENK